MRFSPDSDSNELEIEINVTSFIDVLFVLVLFFMASTSFNNIPSGIDIKLPSAKSGGAIEKPKEMNIVITKDGEVLSEGKSIDSATLSEQLSVYHESEPEGSLIIQADTDVPHGKVVSIMDAARSSGIVKIAIATSPKT